MGLDLQLEKHCNVYVAAAFELKLNCLLQRADTKQDTLLAVFKAGQLLFCLGEKRPMWQHRNQLQNEYAEAMGPKQGSAGWGSQLDHICVLQQKW